MARRTAFQLLRLCLLLFGHLLMKGVAAADLSERFELIRITREDGLTHEVVESIEQTADGFIWMGTRAGLARYDGERIKAITRSTEPAFSETDDSIDLAVDEADGSLWVGLRRGTAHFKNHRWNFLGKNEGLPETGTWKLATVPSGGVWGQVDGGPARLFPNNRIQLPSAPPTNFPSPCISMSCIGDDKLLINQAYDYYIHHPMRRVTTRVTDAQNARIPGSHAPIIRRGSSSYFLSQTNIYRWDYGQPTPTIVRTIETNSGFNDFELSNSGTVWLAGKGIYLQETNGPLHYVYSNEFNNIIVKDLKCDRDGNLWVASGSGVYFLRAKPFKSIDLGEFKGREANPLTVALTRRGGLKVGLAGGLAIFESEGSGPKFTEMREHGMIRLIHELNESETLLVDYTLGGGSYLMTDGKPRAIKDRHLGFALTALVVGTNGSWALHDWYLSHTNEQGLSIYCSSLSLNLLIQNGFDTNHPARFATNSMIHAQFLGLALGRDGVWFGSKSEGLFQLKGDQVKRWRRTDGLPSDYVAPGFEDEDGTLWVLSDRGMARLKNGSIAVIGPTEGLAHSPVFSITPYGPTHFLLATRHGMFLASRQNLHDAADRVSLLTYRSLGPAPEGSGPPIGSSGPNGSIYYPSRNKIVRLDPWEKLSGASSFAPYLDSVTVNGQEIIGSLGRGEGSNPVVGKGGVDVFRITFGSCNFSEDPERKMRYRLQGQSDAWMEASDDKSAYFVNLRPGNYRFELAILDGSGRWSPPVTRTFAIAPYFYQTLWFKGLAGATVFFGAMALHLRRLKLHRELSALREEAALQGERNRIARDMHDSMGSKLTKAALQASAIERAEGPRTNGERAKVSDSIRDAIREMDEIVWLLDSDNNDLASTINYLARDSADLLDGTPLRLWQNIPGEAPRTPVSSEFQRDVIFTVREALNNAAKHSGATQIWLNIEMIGGILRIRIEDDGIGLVPKLHINGTGNGVRNMSNRLRRYGGTCSIHERDPRGLVVLLELPISTESNDGQKPGKN